MKSQLSRNLFRTLFGAGLLAASLCSCCPKHNTLTQAEIADGWQLLFDGKSLDQWKDFNGDSLTMPWHVVDGCIQAKGDGSDLSGYIVTKKQYENFILDWDWKLSYGGNSGMLYHVVENPYFKVPYVTGPEYQLIDNEGWEATNAPTRLEEWQKLGVDYAMHLPNADSLFVNPQGEWNSSRIVCDNGHVEHWLNGRKILEFEAWTDDWFARKNSGKWETAPEYGLAHRGVLCLQDHGYPASFRNLKIKELPRKAGREAELFNGRDLSGWEAYGTEKWYVDKDGLLVCESGPDKKYGYLATREYYDDFDLTVEFKQLANGNSGVFFRSFVEPPVKVHGWQCEVAPKNHLRVLRPRLAGEDSRREGVDPQGGPVEHVAAQGPGRPRADVAQRRRDGGPHRRQNRSGAGTHRPADSRRRRHQGALAQPPADDPVNKRRFPLPDGTAFSIPHLSTAFKNTT